MARTADPKITESVHAAVLEALADIGLHTLSVEAVASRAAVNKTTIYRRWGTIEALLVEVLVAHAEAQVPVPSTGSYRADTTVICRAIRDAVSDPGGRVLLGSLWSSQAERLALVAAQWWENRVKVMEAIVANADARGDCSTNTAPAQLLEQLAGPIHLRSGLVRSPMTDDEIDALVTAVLGP